MLMVVVMVVTVIVMMNKGCFMTGLAAAAYCAHGLNLFN
jgi:hypothetical protein